MILYLLVFAKIPYMRNMAILYKATQWNNLRGACVCDMVGELTFCFAFDRKCYEQQDSPPTFILSNKER